MRYLLTLVTTLSVVTLGCGNGQQSEVARDSTTKSPTDHQSVQREAAILPSDVVFSIVDSNTVPGIKRSLSVRLNKKISEESLRAIALELRAQDPQAYNRTFIAYYLPGMEVGAGAWATTHFDPDLTVQILGPTAEAEARMVAEPPATGRTVVGRWMDDRPYIGGPITIYSDGNNFFLEQVLAIDGSTLKLDLIERSSPSGRRFDDRDQVSGTGDHWIVDPNGALQIRDHDGLIARITNRVQ